MEVAVWSALGRIGAYSTGVGKHIVNMVCGLTAFPDYNVRLLLSSDLHARVSARNEPSRMDGIPDVRLPFSRRSLELLWRTTRRPALDHWLDGSDWVYCPKELYVPVKRMRYAVTVHDLYPLEQQSGRQTVRSAFRWKHLLERALHEADLVLSVSEFTKARLVQLIRLDPGKIRVVGNGVEERFFTKIRTERAGELASKAKPYVLSIGGVTRKKGAVNLLAAAAELARAEPKMTLMIVGPVEREFESRVGEAKNIRIVPRGFSDADMHRLMRNAAVLLSLSEYEGFGIPVLEAMATGVPVVAANRAALPEVVGSAGLLVEPQDTEVVVAGMLQLINDPDRRSELIASGRARAEGYRWSECVNRLRLALEEFSGSRQQNEKVGL